MSHAQTCPVCGGTGQYQPPNPGLTAAPSPRTCHGCGGLGWVTVGAEVVFPVDNSQKFVPDDLRSFYERKGYVDLQEEMTGERIVY